jgi:hypothetical protein
MELKIATLKKTLRADFEKLFKDTASILVATIKKVVSASC